MRRLLFGAIAILIILALVFSVGPVFFPQIISNLPSELGFVIGIIVIVGIILNQGFGITIRDLWTRRQQGRTEESAVGGENNLVALILKSDDPNVLRDQARLSFEQKDYSSSVRFCDALIRLLPNEVDAYERAGRALLRMHQPSRAIQYGQKVIDLQPLHYDGYEIVGEAKSELGEWSEAITFLERALLYAPQEFKMFIYLSLSKAYRSVGNLDKAIESLSEYLAQSSSSPYLLDKTFYQAELNNLLQIRNGTLK